MANKIITVKNVHKTYKKIKGSKPLKAVDDLSFEVDEASCFGFLGPNGAGKTTMMKVIYCRHKLDNHPDSSISVLGYDPAVDTLKIKYASGVVPQDDCLDEELTVMQNLIVYSKLFGIHKKTATKKINELLDFMELSEKKKAPIRALSGGMKRRLSIARALIHDPQLIILDEPTTGLDPQVRHTIWRKLRELKEQGKTILLTTHYMDEAFQICDNIMIMDKGKKILEGEPKTLLANNMEKYVLELVRVKRNILSKLSINHDIVRTDYLHDPPHLYSNSFEALRDIADSIDEGEHYLRQTNLEDLFMKLTGRNLNEEQ